MTTGASLAADLGYGSVKDVPPPAHSGRTFYLKGTIGVSNSDTGGLWNEAYDYGNFTVGHNDVKSAPIFGLGFGVEANRWLRLDVTGEYRGSQLLIGQDSYYTDPCSTAGNCGTNEITADIESWVGLANAYIDLGTFRGITPYVGGGVGFASVSVQGLKDVNVPNNGVAFAGDHTDTNFAWALYAGLSYDVTPQFTMDFGYRYLDLGKARSGTPQAYDPDYDCGCSAFEVKDLTSHDLLISARYRLNEPTPTYALK
jgi:opacity protein-like surface antigen